MTDAPHTVGVFGGSGFYQFLEDVEEVAIATPYGPPSARIRIGEIDGTRVAFMPRHGDHHELPPHRINYRANVWAMREVGAQRILGPCACGSLKPELEPGTFVVADQFVDRTRGREDTFYDGPQTTHVGAVEPYCVDLRAIVVDAAKELGIHVVDGGTELIIRGDVDFGLYPASAMIPIKGVVVAGLLPREVQRVTVFGAGILTDNPSPEPTMAFIKFLIDPAHQEPWKRAGFEPPPGN